jgi:hypothetical protein
MRNPQWNAQIPAIFQNELGALSGPHRQAIFRERTPTLGYWLPTEELVITWTKDGGVGRFGGPTYRPSYAAELPNDFTVGFEIHSTTDSWILGSSLFNLKNPFVQWLVRLKKASTDGDRRVSPQLFENLYEMFHESCEHYYKFEELEKYIQKFSQMAELPSSLRPPDSALSRAMFVRAPNPREKAS